VTVLSWEGNNAGEAGAKMVDEALKTNSTLIILDLLGDSLIVPCQKNGITMIANK